MGQYQRIMHSRTTRQRKLSSFNCGGGLQEKRAEMMISTANCGGEFRGKTFKRRDEKFVWTTFAVKCSSGNALDSCGKSQQNFHSQGHGGVGV